MGLTATSARLVPQRCLRRISHKKRPDGGARRPASVSHGCRRWISRLIYDGPSPSEQRRTLSNPSEIRAVRRFDGCRDSDCDSTVGSHALARRSRTSSPEPRLWRAGSSRYRPRHRTPSEARWGGAASAPGSASSPRGDGARAYLPCGCPLPGPKMLAKLSTQVHGSRNQKHRGGSIPAVDDRVNGLHVRRIAASVCREARTSVR